MEKKKESYEDFQKKCFMGSLMPDPEQGEDVTFCENCGLGYSDKRESCPNCGTWKDD